jgi:hypothetical protein
LAVLAVKAPWLEDTSHSIEDVPIIKDLRDASQEKEVTSEKATVSSMELSSVWGS